MGAEFRLVHEDLYELYIVRHSRLEAYQAISDAFFNIQEYSKKDLYTPTAQVPRLSRYRSRVDDVTVFSNGRKKLSRYASLSESGNVLSQRRGKPPLLVEP